MNMKKLELIGERGSFSYANKGIENSIYIEDTYTFLDVHFSITGDKNSIIVGDATKLHELKIGIRGNGNTITIGKGCKIKGRLTIKGNNQSIVIGDRTTTMDIYCLSLEGKNITIGQDCMISYDVAVRTSDAHSVVSMDTNKRVNLAQDVSIGNHVWLAAHTIIQKGAVISDGSIVGARSIVTKAFEKPNCIIAGAPAKLLKENMTWDRARLKNPDFEFDTADTTLLEFGVVN
jgi:acetyltransferase-like isoleucine patch superfamily enzyme